MPLDDGTLAPSPPMPPPLLQPRQTASRIVRVLSLSIAAHRFLLGFRPSLSDSLIAVIGPRRSHRSRYRLDSVESTGTCPPHHDNTNVPKYSEVTLFPGAPRHSCFVTLGSVLDVCCFHNFVVAPTWRVLLRRILLTQSCKLPHIRWWPIFILSLVVIYFFSLLANGPFHLAVSHLLVPQASCAVTSSISLVFPMFWLIFVTLLCSPASRVTFMVTLSVSHVFFISRVFLCKVSLRSLEPRLYFTPSEPSHFAFLNCPGHFCYLLCFSFSYSSTFSTEVGRYRKTQGGATDYLIPFTRSSALVTYYSQGSTVPSNVRQRLGPLSAPSEVCATRQPLFDTVFWVLLDPRPSLPFKGGTSTLFPSEPPHSSRSRKLTPGAVETLPISISTRQFLSSPQRSSPKSLAAAGGPHRVPQVSDQSDSAKSLSTRPSHCDDTSVPKSPENRLLPSSRWCRLASRMIIVTRYLSETVHEFLPESRAPSLKSLAAFISLYGCHQIRYQVDSAASFGTRPPHHDDTDVLEDLNVVLFLVTPYYSPYVAPSSVFNLCLPSYFAVMPVRPVSFPQFSSTWLYRLHHFRQFLISILSLLIICFFFFISQTILLVIYVFTHSCCESFTQRCSLFPLFSCFPIVSMSAPHFPSCPECVSSLVYFLA